ncbi:hypothetical protein LTR37_003067 [Vermiconidia calcicola]|uniref:Uncharacterized protein n=1 Tax=Vermiconidia calcicola TaxID=1690605 RepID=A0ACC3NRB2_9PEZI|nr:hypothetical protein LTR37_003067 [Vermiconidia calcicola]
MGKSERERDDEKRRRSKKSRSSEADDRRPPDKDRDKRREEDHEERQSTREGVKKHTTKKHQVLDHEHTSIDVRAAKEPPRQTRDPIYQDTKDIPLSERPDSMRGSLFNDDVKRREERKPRVVEVPVRVKQPTTEEDSEKHRRSTKTRRCDSDDNQPPSNDRDGRSKVGSGKVAEKAQEGSRKSEHFGLSWEPWSSSSEEEEEAEEAEYTLPTPAHPPTLSTKLVKVPTQSLPTAPAKGTPQGSADDGLKHIYRLCLAENERRRSLWIANHPGATHLFFRPLRSSCRIQIFQDIEGPKGDITAVSNGSASKIVFVQQWLSESILCLYWFCGKFENSTPWDMVFGLLHQLRKQGSPELAVRQLRQDLRDTEFDDLILVAAIREQLIVFRVCVVLDSVCIHGACSEDINEGASNQGEPARHLLEALAEIANDDSEDGFSLWITSTKYFPRLPGTKRFTRKVDVPKLQWRSFSALVMFVYSSSTFLQPGALYAETVAS